MTNEFTADKEKYSVDIQLRVDALASALSYYHAVKIFAKEETDIRCLLRDADQVYDWLAEGRK